MTLRLPWRFGGGLACIFPGIQGARSGCFLGGGQRRRPACTRNGPAQVQNTERDDLAMSRDWGKEMLTAKLR